MRRVTLFISYSLTIVCLFFYHAFAIADEGVAYDESPADHDPVSSYDFNNNSPSAPSRHYENEMQVASNQSYDDDDYTPPRHNKNDRHSASHHSAYMSRLQQHISGYGEKVIIINPRKHVWGAYSANGELLRAGLASAGSSWCRDLHRPCRTRSGTFRIQSLGASSCKSTRFPIGKGGAPMPYCMFFNGNQGLHGSHELAEGNISHGCVRISVDDAYWVRFNFANIGTKIIVMSY